MNIHTGISKITYDIPTNEGNAILTNHNPESSTKPILFIHGFMSSADVWFEFDDSFGNRALERGYNVWTLELSEPVKGNIKRMGLDETPIALKTIANETKKQVVICAHSMGGLVTRFLTHPGIKEEERMIPLTEIESYIEKIVLLSVPNHGVGNYKGGFVEGGFKLISKVLDELGWKKEARVAFIQLYANSNIFKELNQSNYPVLNPRLKWSNAIGLKDFFVPVPSARFKVEKLEENFRQTNFRQEYFEVDHMVFPGETYLQKISRKLHTIGESHSLISSENLEKIRMYNAIHRDKTVFDWAFGIKQQY